MNQQWAAYAFDPPRSRDALGTGVLRAQPEDFAVEEELGFAPAGAGQHVLLRVRKRNANTQWVARELAKACRCRPSDVGFAGLKDRHAVTTQWFTVPAGSRPLESWSRHRGADFEVLEAHIHSRKLPRGALAANRFAIRVRHVSVDDAQLAARMDLIARCGVPNYFGPQRFGRQGANLTRLATPGTPLRPAERGFVLSAARSLIFNAVLAERVRDHSWERLEAGDLANLDGRGSFFPVTAVDATLRERCARLDIHPTGPLWGHEAPGTGARVLELETRTAEELRPARDFAQAAGAHADRRSLRVAVRDLEWSRESEAVVVGFRLARGSFATAVLREIFEVPDEAQSELDSPY